jgi:hypothetical protein
MGNRDSRVMLGQLVYKVHRVLRENKDRLEVMDHKVILVL